VTWQDRVIAQVQATNTRQRESKRTPFGPDMKPLQFSCTTHFLNYVAAAAEAMGVNRSTFIRRTLAVQAAAVLGVDVRLILFESPQALAHGVHALPRQLSEGVRDHGEGIEAFCPHPGCAGGHLRSRVSGS
jgi:hypothetical protein